MNPYVGEYGMPLELRCGIELPDAAQLSIEARRPDGTTRSWPAVAFGGTSIVYILQEGDISLAGSWRLQSRVAFPGGERFGATAVLSVLPRYR